MKLGGLSICPILRSSSMAVSSFSYFNHELSKDNLDLSLEKLFIIHRHGERSPWSSLLDFAHLFPMNWELCNPESNTLHSHDGSSFHLQTIGDYGLHDNVIVENHEGMCYSGQLTDKGKQTMFNLGKSLSAHYFSSGLLEIQDFEKETFFRSTEFKRAIESVQELLKGWFPKQKHYKIHVRDRAHENLLDPINCPAYVKLEKELELMHESNANPSEKTLREKYPLILGKSDPFGKQITIYSAYDSMECRRAHGLSLPDNFTEKDLQLLKEYYINGDFKKYYNQKLTRLKMGRFFLELLESIFNDTQKKLYVYSAHDSTLLPILITLGYELIFPPYASYIAFEIYKDKGNQRKIVLKFNGQVFKPDGCNDTICTERELRAILEPTIPVDYLKECMEE